MEPKDNKTSPVAPCFGKIRQALCFCLLLACSSPLPVSAAIEADREDAREPLLSWMQDSFVYQREGRPDPFTPFIPEKLIQVEVGREELTGMRRFEPGQLNLVSIVITESEPVALVQDSVGKGYILREGSKIGRSGIVSAIVPNQIVIQQQMLTPTGEKRSQTVEMVLRKEGDK